VYKWIMSGIVAVACLFAVGLLIYALPEKEPSESAEPSSSFAVPDAPVQAEAAEQIYKSSCLSCHGDQLEGRLGPKLSQVGATLTKEQIYKQIAKGGGGMPKFEGKLSEDELVTITNWLAEKK